MNVKLQRSYTSKNRNKVFVYGVTGTKADLEQFKEIQADNYREDDKGNPLWFTVNCIGPQGKLIITTNNKIVPDMSEFDQAASLAAQYGGNFGAELARASAQRLAGGGGFSAPSAPAPQAPVHQAPEIDDPQVD